MRILIHAKHYPVCSARYAADAFRRLGHTVKTVGPEMGRSVWGIDLPTWAAWKPDGELPVKAGDSADVVVAMDSDPDILDAGRIVQGCPVVVWGVDNHVRDYRREHFDHYFLAHKAVSVMPWQDDMTHLPCAYDPTLHTPSPIKWNEREYDVAMVGVMYPRRWQLVQKLHEAGLSVFYGTGLIGESYREAYHNARVALCDSANGDLAQRVFEAAAMGCAVVADWCKDMPQALSGMVYDRDDFDRAVELAQHAVLYPVLARPDMYMKWAKPHTWDNRAQRIIDWLEVNRETKAVS